MIYNFSFLGKVIWQRGVLKKVYKSDADVFIFLGEMNIISTWISSIILRHRNKKVVYWGHGLYGNENKAKNFLD